MPKYRVFPKCVISTSIEVEAEDEAEAIEKALDEMPQTQVMFLDHTWPDQGDWDAEAADVEAVD